MMHPFMFTCMEALGHDPSLYVYTAAFVIKLLPQLEPLFKQ